VRRLGVGLLVLVVSSSALIGMHLSRPGGQPGNQSNLSAVDRLPYPQGDQFPMMLYSVVPEHLASVKSQGFNLVHTYSFNETWLEDVRANGLHALVPIGTYDQASLWSESQARAFIESYKDHDRVAWWNLPEEMTWTVDWKLKQVADLSSWVRQYDGKKRPTYEYLAGNYIAYDIRNYVPYVDIIGIGAYVDYNEQPRQWIRWAVKQVTDGITQAGYSVGSDYLGKERVPVAVLQMFIEGGTHVQTGPESYHDVWSAVCAGAKGVLVFSHHYRVQFPSKVYEAFVKAAGQLTGQEGLGKVALFGEDLPSISATVISGPSTTPPFDTWGGKGVSFPTVNMMARQYEGKRYLFAVNDVDQRVTVRFSNLPTDVIRVGVIDEGRIIPVVDGAFSDVFGNWAVHLYALE